MATSVLVTRPAGQADELLRALAQAGYASVHHQPMLELVPLKELAAAQRQHVLDLDCYQHVIFISSNAVRFGLECIEDYWPQLPSGINWYAIGDATARILEARGLSPLSPKEQINSEGLLALPELVHPTQRIGGGKRGWIEGIQKLFQLLLVIRCERNFKNWRVHPEDLREHG